jgi:hypothetical protein
MHEKLDMLRLCADVGVEGGRHVDQPPVPVPGHFDERALARRNRLSLRPDNHGVSRLLLYLAVDGVSDVRLTVAGEDQAATVASVPPV